MYELLGGPVRDRIRVYQWAGGDRPEGVADAGFSALKMNAMSERRRIDTPATVGPDVDIGIDFHGRVAKSMVKRLAGALEPNDPFFIEEPVLPEQNEFLPHLASHTSIPIATGERMYSRWDFKEVFESGAVDVIQPDLSHAGGITEVHKIASMAKAYDVALAPHCPLGPVALALCLQVDACSPNALIQEQSLDIHYNEGVDVLDYLTDLSVFDDEEGYVSLPDGPSLGVEPDEEVLRERAGHDDWHNPIWRHDDGGVAEW